MPDGDRFLQTDDCVPGRFSNVGARDPLERGIRPEIRYRRFEIASTNAVDGRPGVVPFTVAPRRCYRECERVNPERPLLTATSLPPVQCDRTSRGGLGRVDPVPPSGGRSGGSPAGKGNKNELHLPRAVCSVCADVDGGDNHGDRQRRSYRRPVN